MTPLPKAPSKVGKFFDFIRTLLRCLAERTPLDSKDFRKVETANGWYYEATKRDPSKRVPVPMFPFRIYSLRDSERRELGLDYGDHSWRRVFVRSAFVNLLSVTGTDESLFPDDPTDFESNDETQEIDVPLGETEYFIWVRVEFDNEGVISAKIEHGLDPAANGWDAFDYDSPAIMTDSLLPNVLFYLVGVVDTQFAIDEYQPYGGGPFDDEFPGNEIVVRQHQRADINASPSDALDLDSDAAVRGHPFQIYTLSDAVRTSLGLDTIYNTWRKVFVRSGYLNLCPVTNTDGAKYPDAKSEPVMTGGALIADCEITIPLNTEAYYIWIESTWDTVGVLTAEIWHGETPPTDGWTDFSLTTHPARMNPTATPMALYHLVAIVDTKTAYDLPDYDDDDKKTKLLVRQFQRTDINASVPDVLDMKEFMVCIDDVPKYAFLPSAELTDAATE